MDSDKFTTANCGWLRLYDSHMSTLLIASLYPRVVLKLLEHVEGYDISS